MEDSNMEILEKIINGEPVTAAELELLSDEERALLPMVQQIDKSKADEREAIVNEAQRKLDYMIARIREDEHEGFAQKIDRFLGNIYYRLGLLDGELLESQNEKFNFNITKPLMIACSFILFFLFLKFVILSENIEPEIVKPIPKITTVATYENARLMPISDSVRAAAGSHTIFKIMNDNIVELRRGSLWLDVEKGGKGFEVDTDFGKITVMGTSFGVFYLGSQVVVEVSEGTVLINKDSDDERAVSQGEKIVLNSNGTGLIQTRSEGEVRPEWVRNLEREDWMKGITSQIAYWNMEVNPESELITDLGPYQMHGEILTKSRPRQGVPSIKSSLFGSALSLNHKRLQNIQLKNSQILSQIKDDFTVMAWVKRRSDEGHQRIIAAVGDGWRYGFINNTLIFDVYPGNGSPKMYGVGGIDSIAPVGKWVHVACVVQRSENQVIHFVNGEMIKALPLKAPVHPGLNHWRLGAGVQRGDDRMNKGSSTFDGFLDEVRVFNEGLDAESIRKIGKIDLVKGGKENTEN